MTRVRPILRDLATTAIMIVMIVASGWIALGPATARGESADPPSQKAEQSPADAKGEHHPGNKQGKNEHADDDDKNGHRPNRQAIHDHIVKVLYGNLELTDDQNGKIHKITAHARKQRRDWVKAHHDEMRDLRDQMRQARKDQDKARIKRISKKFRELMKSAPKPTQAIAQVRKVLDKDQRKQFNKNLKKLRREIREYIHRGKNKDKGKGKGKDKDQHAPRDDGQ